MMTVSESFLGAVRVDFHDHLVFPTNISSLCEACGNSEERDGCQSGYICKPCNLYVHKDCVVKKNYRHKHPLKLLWFNQLLDIGRTCYFCGKKVSKLFYHCFQCDMSFCNLCASILLFIDDVHKKIHEHSLTQMMIKVSFTCDACGICSYGFPCVCLQCCFIIHRDCIKLPRVIHVNRHDHRVSHTYSLGPGDWVCGVCRKGIDRSCGAYSCSNCSYAVHSKCATRGDVWDGYELEDKPEVDEDIDPFVVIGEGVIKHFSHEHHLRSLVDGNSDKRYCYACTLPIHSDPCYTCVEECGYILHQTCANLPKKKRHELSKHQLTLYTNPELREIFEGSCFKCSACKRRCTGFCYKNIDAVIDVRCVQVSDRINHGSHPHPLFSISTEDKLCMGCGYYREVMSCIEGDFDLCFYCATLPKEVRHKYDRHPLSLCYGESESERGFYWCEICEAETNPNEWFYTCNECGSTLHVDCVLGDYLHVRPGHSIITYDEEFEVVANDRPTRPFCFSCKKRCVQPFAYMSKADSNTYLCVYSCLLSYRRSYSGKSWESEEDVRALVLVGLCIESLSNF